MEDAVNYYREKYGGKMNVLIDEEKTWNEETERYEFKVVGSYYVLTVSDEKRLTNGFRFLKELRLQHRKISKWILFTKCLGKIILVFIQRRLTPL